MLSTVIDGMFLATAAMLVHRFSDCNICTYNDWVKKCMEYEVEGARSRGRSKRTLTEVVQKDCQAGKLNREDATDCRR